MGKSEWSFPYPDVRDDALVAVAVGESGAEETDTLKLLLQQVLAKVVLTPECDGHSDQLLYSPMLSRYLLEREEIFFTIEAGYRVRRFHKANRVNDVMDVPLFVNVSQFDRWRIGEEEEEKRVWQRNDDELVCNVSEEVLELIWQPDLQCHILILPPEQGGNCHMWMSDRMGESMTDESKAITFLEGFLEARL